MNTNSRHWSFTWETNAVQKKLPNEKKLEAFLNAIADKAQFQKERGAEKQKLHFQGYFELSGKRISKSAVLKLFQNRFKNCKGLTIRKVFSVDAILDYTSKQATRDSPTVYCGKKEIFDEKYTTLISKPWQIDLFVFLKMIKNNVKLGHPGDTKRLRKRALIWLEDPRGGSGKSELIKWLRGGQKDLVCRLLPIDSVDRLSHAIISLTQSEKIDVFMIDDTRSKGEGSSFNQMFEAIEKIKNGHMVSTMYGQYRESMYDNPTVIFFTNREMHRYHNSLSLDRWYRMTIDEGFLLRKHGWISPGSISPDYWEKYFDTSPDYRTNDVPSWINQGGKKL